MEQKRKIKELRQLELFHDLDEEEFLSIMPYFKKRRYKRGEVVYSTYTSAHHFIFVLSGKIKIYRLSELGKEQIIRTIEPTEFTGELALFEGVRKAYAEAMEVSEIYVIEHEHFKEILAKYPKISLKMIETLAYRLHLSEEQTSWMSTSTAKERLWIYLQKESALVDGKRVVHYEQTKRFLASYLGMSSETLSRSLHQLEEEGKIREYPDHMIEIVWVE